MASPGCSSTLWVGVLCSVFNGAAAIGVAAYRGLLTARTFALAAFCLVPLVAALALGSRIFQRVDPASIRRNVLLLLAALAIAGLLRSAF
jgi:uncharacterized membrane protein YfcA